MFFAAQCFGQTLSVNFETPNDVWKEEYSASNEGSVVKSMNIIITRDKLSVKDTGFVLLEFQINHHSSSDKDVRLITQTIKVSANDIMNEAKLSRKLEFELYKDSVDTDTNDEAFSVTILVDTTFTRAMGFKEFEMDKAFLTIEDAPKPKEESIPLNPLNPFRITTGANFDFQTTIKASFYFDASFNNPLLCSFKKNGRWGMGFYGSMYNNRYITSDSVSRIEEFQTLIGSDSDDTVDIVESSGRLKIANTVKTIGFECGALLSVVNNKSEDQLLQFSIILPEIGAIHRRVHSEYSYSTISSDTVEDQPRPESVDAPMSETFINTRHDEVLVGGGFIFRYANAKFGEIVFKTSHGYAHIKNVDETYYRGYYCFRVQVLDPKYNINLGGEVRGYYNQPTPYIGVYLSKSFGLNKLQDIFSK